MMRAAGLALVLVVMGFGFDGKQSVHTRITRDALDVLRPSVRAVIEEENQAEDKGESYSFPERHFSNCLFRESVGYINMRYRGTVASLARGESRPAAMQFGMLLHGVQDFYAHSAWVDPAPIGFGFGRGRTARSFERGTGAWILPPAWQPFDDSMVVIQGNPPPGVSVELQRDAGGRPMSAVPLVTIDGRRYRGLMTSTAGPISFATAQCPPVGDDCWSNESVCIRHAEPRKEPAGRDAMVRCQKETPEIYENCFHHDDPRRPRYDEAVAAAIRQTAHEWCRLLHLTRADTSGYATALLLGLWVAPAPPRFASAHPLGTPCAPAQPGTRAVSVRLTAVSDSGAEHYTAALFTTDFRRSARMQFKRGDLPLRPLALCVTEGDSLMLAVWAWTGDRDLEVDARIVGSLVLRLSTAARVQQEGRRGLHATLESGSREQPC